MRLPAAPGLSAPAGPGPLTAVSLFAGIGGLDLACQRAGIDVRAAVEIDPACRGVLARHFPATTLFEDVTEVTGDQLRATGFVPRHGVVCAGWPCQGNSVAGRRGGLADPRSGLWRHVVRILAATRPRWFIGENVHGLLSIHHGQDFATVLRDLDELGYGVAWRVLDAQWFGVPQRRRRVFLAGCLGDGAAPVQVLLEPESGGGHPPQGRQAGPEVAGTLGSRVGGARTTDLDGHGAYVVSTLQGGGRRGHRVDAEGAAGGHLVAVGFATSSLDCPRDDGLAPPVKANRNGQDTGSGASVMVATPAGVRRLTPRECERLQGFPDDWTRWLADGTEQSDSARYRELGNAVAVPVAGWLTGRLAAADRAARSSIEGSAAA